MAIYFAMKYLTLSSINPSLISLFEMKYDDCDGKQNVINILRSFCNLKTPKNKMAVCLLEIGFRGFERKFPTSDHMLAILKLENKFRIVQSFEQGFSLQQELNARDWIGNGKMKELAECIIDVVLGKDQKKAMNGFQKLFRIPLKPIKKKFKNRKTTGCFGIYVAKDVDVSKWISTGSVLIGDVLRNIKK